MEDAIETLLGEEIVDELDEHEDMRELAREQAEAGEEVPSRTRFSSILLTL